MNKESPDGRNKGARPASSGNPKVNVVKRPTGLVKSGARPLTRSEKKDAAWERGEKSIVRTRGGVDRPMLAIILILIALGTVMVFSASYPNAYIYENDSMFYLKKQLFFVAIGGVLMAIASIIPYEYYKKLSPAVYVCSLGLLAAVLVYGTARGVAQRWIYLGFISFQPSEAGKIGLVLMLAWYFDKHYSEINIKKNKKNMFWRGVAVPGMIMAAVCGLVALEKHLSGTLIIGMIGVCVIFLGGANIAMMAATYGSALVAFVAVYLMANPYALQRITTHADENADILAEAWQTTQGLYAIGSGGFLGVGLGDSRLKYNYVSEAQNDFIFTIWCEEMGFVGAVILIALYSAFVWRGFTIAKKAPDTYTSLVAFGITCQVGIQAMLNMLVVTDIIPNTGISLPFFSYGGTSLVMLMAEMGLLLSISRHSYQKK